MLRGQSGKVATRSVNGVEENGGRAVIMTVLSGKNQLITTLMIKALKRSASSPLTGSSALSTSMSSGPADGLAFRVPSAVAATTVLSLRRERTLPSALAS